MSQRENRGIHIIAKNEVILAAIQPMSSAKLKQQQQQQFNTNLLRWGHNLKNNPIEECSSDVQNTTQKTKD
jgi:hypothetical protein